MSTKFLSLEGLDQYDGLIKEYIDAGLVGKSGSTHIHDDRYYTESEIDQKLSGKSDIEHKHTVSEITDLTATATELNYMDGVTSNVQTQIDNIINGTKTVSKATSATYASSATTATNAGTATYAKDSEKLGGQLPSYYAKASDIPTGTLANKNYISESDLDSALAEKVNAASEGNHSHLNKAVLDGITSAKVSAWDSAESNAKAYTDTSIANLVDSAPDTLNTLGELATAMKEHEDVIDALNESITSKVSIAQGEENSGKILAVNESGNVFLSAAPEVMDINYDSNKQILEFMNKPQLPGNVGIDGTLSVSGNAADAKVVGDKFAELETKTETAINEKINAIFTLDGTTLTITTI